MSEGIEILVRAVLTGIGATVVMDLWGVFQKRVPGLPTLNYGMVGRWFGSNDEIGECMKNGVRYFLVFFFEALVLLILW